MFGRPFKFLVASVDFYFDEPVADLPRKDVGIVPTVVVHLPLHGHCWSVVRLLLARGGSGRTSASGRLWFRSADDSRPDAARLLIAVEDFRDAAVGDAELSGDDARTDSGRGQLDDFESDVVGQRTAVDKDAAQLVDPALTFD